MRSRAAWREEFRYQRRKRSERLAYWIARHLPREVQKWVVVYAAVRAREPEYRPGGGYCGPDGLTYKDLHDAVSRR